MSAQSSPLTQVALLSKTFVKILSINVAVFVVILVGLLINGLKNEE